MSEDRTDQVRQIVADVFGVPLGSVDADSSPETIESWESLTHLNLVMALEQVFGVRFDPDEIARLTSIRAIVDMVQQKS